MLISIPPRSTTRSVTATCCRPSMSATSSWRTGPCAWGWRSAFARWDRRQVIARREVQSTRRCRPSASVGSRPLCEGSSRASRTAARFFMREELKFAQREKLTGARRDDPALGEVGRFARRPAVPSGARCRGRARRRSPAVASRAARPARVPAAGHEGLVCRRLARPASGRQHGVVRVVLAVLRRLPARPFRRSVVRVAGTVLVAAHGQSNGSGAASRPRAAGTQPGHSLAVWDVAARSPRRVARCRRCRGGGRDARVQPGCCADFVSGPVLPAVSGRWAGGARPCARRVGPVVAPSRRRARHGRRPSGRRLPRHRSGPHRERDRRDDAGRRLRRP